MHRELFMAMGLMLLFCCLASLPATQGQSADDLDGDHVCYCWQWKVEYKLVNISYDCWSTEKVSGSDCDEEDTTWEEVGSTHHHRWKRTWGSDWETDYEDEDGETYCFIHTKKTCTRVVTKCYRQYTKVEYCCNGYEEDGMGGCRKTIECSDDNGGCEQMCISSYGGGHYCKCMPGYRLVDNTKCVDIDECSQRGKGGCQYGCQNVDGSYYCTCPPGYERTSATECKERNECQYGNGGCEHTCVNTDGAFHCLCRDGFTLKNGNECHDVDECDFLNGGCSHTCDNGYGRYRCKCPTGHMLGADDRTCIVGVETTRFREDGSFPPTPSGPYPTGDWQPSPPGEAEQKDGSDDDDSLAGGTIAGIAVGALIGLVCLAALLFLLLCLARRLYARNAAAAAATSNVYTAPATDTPHAYAAPVVAVLPVPIKKPAVALVVTPGDEKTAYAYDNEVYGTVWGDIPATTSKPAPEEVTEVKTSEPVYDNVDQPDVQPSDPVYGNVVMSNGKAKPLPPPRPDKTLAYDNALNEKKSEKY